MGNTEILFICRKQFGYSVDNYFHCKYLRNEYRITYLSPHVGWEKVFLDDINYVYIDFHGNRIINNLRFYIAAIHKIYNSQYKLVILNRSHFFFLFKLFQPFKTFIYDIRSGIVNPNWFKRKVFTLLLKIDILFYKNVTIISHSLAKKLNIKKYKLLPLGAEAFNLSLKNFDEISMVYVGTLNNRRIEDTIVGFSEYLKEFPNDINISYHIYGYGNFIHEKKIIQTIEFLKLGEKVFFHGRFSHEELKNILSRHNVGISYVPITPWFDVQPPTKTFEYLLAGMPVIATETKENALVINHTNGVLIPDSSEGFRSGVKTIHKNINRNRYSSTLILRNSAFYSWENIVLFMLKPYIDSLLIK